MAPKDSQSESRPLIEQATFVGRQTELEQFRQALGKRSFWRRWRDLPPKDFKSRVFLPHGIGGIGKSWLSQRCLKEADERGWRTVEIDWDTVDYRPSEPDQMMDMIADALQQICGERFTKSYTQTRTEIKRVKKRVKRLQQDNQKTWLRIVDDVKNITEGGLTAAQQKELGKGVGQLVEGAGDLVNLGATTLAKAEDRFLDWLVERNKIKPDEATLYRKPEAKLAEQLVEVILAAARRRPLVVLFDSGEVLSLRLEEWLRDAIVCPAVKKQEPLLVIVAGRYQQYVGREVEDDDGNRRHVKGYADRLTNPPPIAWDLNRFAEPEIATYLQAHGLEPDEALVDLVQQLALGVPFAVQLVTQALCKLGEDKVRQEFPPKNHEALSHSEMVRLVVQRFLSHCVDKTDQERIRTLALLREPDIGALRATWNLEDDRLPREVLAELAARYGFLKVNGRLHEVVRHFLREDMRHADRERARRLGKALVAYYQPRWEEAVDAVANLDEQTADRRCQNLTLDLLNALCWGDETTALTFIAARVIEYMEFNRGFATVLLKLTQEFHTPEDWWPIGHHRLWNILAQIVVGDLKQEWAGLEALMESAEDLELQDSHLCIVRLWRARNLLRQEQYDESLTVLQEARHLLAEESQVLQQRLGEAFYEVSSRFLWPKGATTSVRSEKGLKAAQTAVELRDESGSAYHNLGAALFTFQHYREAEEAVRKAINLDPDLAPSWNGLGYVYHAQGRDADAEAAYRKAIDLDPEDATPWHGLGKVYRAQDRYADAEAAYRKVIDLDPDLAAPWHGLGNVYADLGRYEDAEDAYRTAIDLDPDFAYPWSGLGYVYRDLGRYEDAEAAYRTAIDLDPEFAYPWNGLGNVYYQQGRHADAKAAYRKAIDLDPDFAWPYNNLGLIYEKQEKYDAAANLYQQAVERHTKPEDEAVSWRNLGDVYRTQGRYADAKAAYRKAAELEPREPAYHTGLGTVLELQDQLEEALSEHQRAVELEPDNGMRCAALASVLRKLGREEEAEAHLSRARELMANEDDYNKACLEAIAGNVEAALVHLERALAQAPGDRDWAARDPDLEPLHGDPRFEALVGGETKKSDF